MASINDMQPPTFLSPQILGFLRPVLSETCSVLRESDTSASGQGVEMTEACDACPETMAALRQAPTMRGCSLGYAFFSVLAPGTRIQPHCALHPLFTPIVSIAYLSRARV